MKSKAVQTLPLSPFSWSIQNMSVSMFAYADPLDVLPHGMHVRRRQTRTADRRAVVGPHYSLGKQEIAEQAGHQQVLTEQLLKQIWQTSRREIIHWMTGRRSQGRSGSVWGEPVTSKVQWEPSGDFRGRSTWASGKGARRLKQQVRFFTSY